MPSLEGLEGEKDLGGRFGRAGFENSRNEKVKKYFRCKRRVEMIG